MKRIRKKKDEKEEKIIDIVCQNQEGKENQEEESRMTKKRKILIFQICENQKGKETEEEKR